MRIVLLAVLVCPAMALAASPVERRLTAVTLSSGGVGQYSFIAHLDAAGEVALDVPLAQVDDLLANLQITDPAGGAPSVRLQGRQPTTETFHTLPFGPDALASSEALLGALFGAAVRLPGANLAGSILSVTPIEQRLENGTVTRHRLAIATATGVASVVLEDQPEVEIVSDQLRSDIARALRTIAEDRNRDRRTLLVQLPGDGARDVRLSYVVPAPVWKASYRITLPADGQARLHGYAVVENLSEQDWHGVAVTLTSGQPVLFHQPLYEAVFVDRPEAPVQVSRRLSPLADAGAQPAPAAIALPMAPPPPAPMMQMRRARASEDAVAEAAEPGATTTQEATQVEFTIDAPVDAAAGQSLLLPILDRAIPARRVALVSPETDGTHPFVALQITNDTSAALPPGLATLYAERGAGFVGNALLPATQPNEDRLLSFASDLSTRVVRTESGDSAVASIHAARGMMTITQKERDTVTFHVTTAADAPRHMLFEEPARAGWNLAEPAGAGRTPTRWRVSQDIAADTTQDVRLVMERLRSQTLSIDAAAPSTLLEYARDAALDPAARAAFARLGELRSELARRTAAVATLKDQVAAVVSDQDRLRANLTVTAQNQALQKRYTSMLQQQEDDLAALRARLATAQASANEQRAALDDALGSVSF